MNQLQQVNERSTAWLTVTFRDKTGAAQAPTSATYRIHDAGSGALVREAVLSAPGSTVEIVLTDEDNALRNPAAGYEKRRVTVEAQFGQGDAVTAEFVYQVLNLAGVTNA
jgi:hypothetical protein